MSNAEYVRKVLLSCPHITDGGNTGLSGRGGSTAEPHAGAFELAIDFLDAFPARYSIESGPAAQIVKQYLGGGAVRRYPFSLLARYESVTDEDRAANAKHYEDLALWLEGVTRRRKLPPMDGGATPRSLLATGNGYLEERAEDGMSATYRMQMELVYTR